MGKKRPDQMGSDEKESARTVQVTEPVSRDPKGPTSMAVGLSRGSPACLLRGCWLPYLSAREATTARSPKPPTWADSGLATVGRSPVPHRVIEPRWGSEGRLYVHTEGGEKLCG